MSIESEADIEALKHIGRIVGLILFEMQQRVAPGVKTSELDAVCADALLRHGARSTPRHEYGFPAASCISVNDEVVHGIPSGRILQPGDVVKLDVTADIDGYVAVAARTVIVPPAAERAVRLAECARSAFNRAMGVARAGTRIRDLGRCIETEVKRCGGRAIRELAGHGVGRKIHEPPTIPNYFEPRCRGRLTEGLVITIEPIISAGSGRAANSADGWTVRTADRSLSVHHEETVIVTRGEPIVLTAV